MNVELVDSLRAASKKIAPLWSLDNFVAVNPYLGLIDNKFDQVASDLSKTADIQMTLPSSYYLKKINDGKLNVEDLNHVLKSKGYDCGVEDFLKLVEKSDGQVQPKEKVSTVIDLAKEVTRKDWNRFFIHRMTVWAAAYFDKKQALWSTSNTSNSIFEAWKFDASIDLSTELSGLKNFRKYVKELPNDPVEAAAFSLKELGLKKAHYAVYFHRLLLRVGGWSAFASRQDWESELHGGKDGSTIEFLAILICWESILLKSVNNLKLNELWQEKKDQLVFSHDRFTLEHDLTKNLILQEAFDLSSQKSISRKFQSSKKTASIEEVKAQMVFCIDVRSEVYRRNLEAVDSNIETMGFAGFFGFPVNYKPAAFENIESQCPVLLPGGPEVKETLNNQQAFQSVIRKRRNHREFGQVWKQFKSSAVSCFSFVSPLGLSYLPKLVSDSLHLTRPVKDPEKIGYTKQQFKDRTISVDACKSTKSSVGIPFETKVQLAKGALKTMSLTKDFATFVLITGHGSTTVNNPHATGYDCGACAGHSGEANAKVAAAVLNDKQVRLKLREEGIDIPEDTLFLACLHDTTTDEITVYNENQIPHKYWPELQNLKNSLNKASSKTRLERSRRFAEISKNVDNSIFTKSKDWAETRPEWGLAGCSSFIVAPRKRSRGIDFGGRSFLHSYEWKNDTDFSILETIMTAPMVVTSWISLQYYASTVDNKNFGSGNKTLHNVTSGLGVIEGYSGDLRVGLPLQAIHDGEDFQHEPVRLNVIIEAPMEEMNKVLQKHKNVKDLCDNNWINLLAMDEDGLVSHRYIGNLKWEVFASQAA